MSNDPDPTPMPAPTEPLSPRSVSHCGGSLADSRQRYARELLNEAQRLLRELSRLLDEDEK